MNKVTYLFPFTESFVDYPNNESLVISIYFLGCNNNCENCSNIDLQDKKYSGHNVKNDNSIDPIIDLIYEDAKQVKTNKLVFIGGDPLFEDNVENTKNIIQRLKKDFSICIYTGKSVNYAKMNKVTDFTFLKTGQYTEKYKQEALKTDEYMQFASYDQELYDIEYQLLSANGIYYFK